MTEDQVRWSCSKVNWLKLQINTVGCQLSGLMSNCQRETEGIGPGQGWMKSVGWWPMLLDED